MLFVCSFVNFQTERNLMHSVLYAGKLQRLEDLVKEVYIYIDQQVHLCEIQIVLLGGQFWCFMGRISSDLAIYLLLHMCIYVVWQSLPRLPIPIPHPIQYPIVPSVPMEKVFRSVNVCWMRCTKKRRVFVHHISLDFFGNILDLQLMPYNINLCSLLEF